MMKRPTSSALVVACMVMACIPLLALNTQDKGDDEGRQVTEITIDAPVEAVWAAFTTQAGCQSWMAPIVEIDFKIRGTIRTNYNPDGKIGDAGTIENKILSYDPLRMISLKVAKAPEGFPFPNAIKDMWHVVYFTAETPTRTKITEVGLGFTDTAESKTMREFFKGGNASVLARLKTVLEK